MPVSFSYSGERVFTKNSSNDLMNELSCITAIDFGAAAAPRAPSASPAVPATATVMNSRRVVMRASCLCEMSGWLGLTVAPGGGGRLPLQAVEHLERELVAAER